MKLFRDMVSKLIVMEASGNKGIKYRVYKAILSVQSKVSKKTVKTKWFWSFERFRLPPYWWHTKTFKILTICTSVILVLVVGVYFYNHFRAENIVSSIVITSSSVSDISDVTSDDRPLAYNNSLYKEDSEGNIEFNFLENDLSDAISRNDETVGWIKIGAVDIDYPVVRHTDNDYYLSHDFDKNNNSAGWVFMDYRCDSENSRNIVIYGHNLMSGGMFSSLSRIRSNNEKVYVQYQTRYKTSIYVVVSVYETSPDNWYIQQDFTDEEYTDFINKIVNKNNWKYSDVVTDNDTIMTLSTCYGDNRLVVHCKLVASKLP